MKNRPFGIIILSILVFFITAIALVVGLSTLIPGTPLDIVWSIKNSFPLGFQTTMFGKIFGSFILILGIIMLLSAYGLLKGNKIAYWTILIIFIINLMGDLISVLTGRGIENLSGIVIVGILIFYMTRPSVRKYFNFI